MLVSDGVVEAALAGGAQYGDAHLAEQIQATRSLPPQATVRAIQHHLIETVGDRLHDDATLLVLDWHGSEAQARPD